jgi:methionyl-tRNA formyltransferase
VQESPVHQCATQNGIEVRTPVNFKRDEDIAAFMALELDVAVVAAYGLILPKVILDAPKYGCLNIHASLLPRWRGAAPIHRAIMEGDSETGITIMQMDEGLDTGPMIARRAVAIRDTTTAQSLHDMLSAVGSAMIEDVLDRLAEEGHLEAALQPEEGVTYAKMLKKEEGHIDWNKPAAVIDRQIRALNPWPGTWTQTDGGKRLKILEAHVSELADMAEPGMVSDRGIIACGGHTALRVTSVQPENKKPMDITAAYNGGYLKSGLRLS